MHDAPKLVPGQLVGAYKVDAIAGEGANAHVYLVRHRMRTSLHALKVLKHADARKRMRIEQEAVFRDELRHPNIVPAIEAVDVNGRPGLVMDFVEGPSLDRWWHEADPSLADRLAVLRGVLEGVGFAHERGVVHRDLKPSNVLLAKEGTRYVPRISDFGLAKALSPEIGRFGGLTTVNTGLGTVGYAAPEQVRDASRVDHRADLYAFGCLLYEATTGIAPFAGLSTMDTLLVQQQGRYRPSEEIAPGAPAALHALIRELLSPRPEERPADARAVAERLDRIVADVRRAPSTPDVNVANDESATLVTVAALCAIPTVALAIGAAVVLR